MLELPNKILKKGDKDKDVKYLHNYLKDLDI
jgi:hypothetical protein